MLTKVKHFLSETTLKRGKGSSLEKLFQGLWPGLCDAQQGVWIMLSDVLILQQLKH